MNFLKKLSSTHNLSQEQHGLITIFLLYMISEIIGLSKKLEKINASILIISLIFSALMLAQNRMYVTESIFHIYTSFLIIPTLIFTTILLLINIRRTQNRGQILILIGFLFTFLAGAHDAYYFSVYKMPYFWWTAYGFALLQLLTLISFTQELKDLFQENIAFSNSLMTTTKNTDKIKKGDTKPPESSKTAIQKKGSYIDS